MSSRWNKLLSSGIAAVLFSTIAFAADTAASPAQVSSTFRVVVKDFAQKPKADVRVTLGKQNAYTLRPLMRGSTSVDGILSFGKIAPGQYTLQFVDAGSETNLLPVEVVAKGGQAELDFSWPHIHWIPMQHISGILMNGPNPLNHRNLVLRNFPGETMVAAAETDLLGGFDLPVSTPGRYVIDISRRNANGESESLGRIYTIVSVQGERQGSEQLFVEQLPQGGLEYDRICKLQSAELKDSCFQSLAGDGSPLASVILKIRPASGFSPDQTYTSDAEGMIKLPLLPAGTYEAQLYAKGMVPVTFSVKLSGNAGACTSPLKISFNVIGSGCAPATTGKAN